jgi:phytoene synthase
MTDTAPSSDGSGKTGGQPESYCAELLRRYDRDRFLTCLFAPPERREALFAVHAFGHEVAKVAEIVTEPMAGQIRLQWWREALDGIYAGAPRKHHVAEPLSKAVRDHDLSRGELDRLLDAREQDLDEYPPPDLDALESYADGTGGTLARLGLEVLGVRDSASRSAAGHIGTAWALTGLIRAIPFHAAQRRLMMPADLVAEAELDPHDLFELRHPKAARAVAVRVATRAWEHLQAARAARRQVPKAATPALLPGTLAEGYLKVLASVDYDPFAERVRLPLPGRGLRLLWGSTTGRF